MHAAASEANTPVPSPLRSRSTATRTASARWPWRTQVRSAHAISAASYQLAVRPGVASSVDDAGRFLFVAVLIDGRARAERRKEWIRGLRGWGKRREPRWRKKKERPKGRVEGKRRLSPRGRLKRGRPCGVCRASLLACACASLSLFLVARLAALFFSVEPVGVCRCGSLVPVCRPARSRCCGGWSRCFLVRPALFSPTSFFLLLENEPP
ncbi:hypothetical protein [Pandoravirus japonicus]|uniref:Uncharacterized protein n=1 Tax=Pandoravirus japonicus TaxID=2823154 RepID=A0A811BRP7_9VIRU|nr:hypothetical protein [Pandoravirus japonicus]